MFLTQDGAPYTRSASRQILITLLTAILLAISTYALAGESGGERVASDVGNFGFEKDPPVALMRRFPMCDAFIKVKWISKERQIGYSEFEAPLQDKNGLPIGKGKVSALVMMKGAPDMRYEVSYFKEKGELEMLFEALRNGEITGGWGGTGFDVSYLSENFHINFASGPGESSFEPVLSGYQRTVCVVYPDGRRAWILEGRRPEKIFDQGQLDSLFVGLKSAGAEVAQRQLAEGWVLDINGDGISDYVTFGKQWSFTYSSGKRYYTASVMKDARPPSTGTPTSRSTTYTFPPQNRSCALKLGDAHYLTTDGKSYFINNQCNLTGLTRPVGKD